MSNTHSQNKMATCLEDQRLKQAYCDSGHFHLEFHSEGKCSLCVRLYQENWVDQLATKKVNRTGV